MSFKRGAKTYILLFTILFSLVLKAQKTDSLWAIWNDHDQHDTTRLNAIGILSWKTLFVNYDSAYILAELLHDLAIDIEELEKQAYAFKIKGIVMDYRHEYDSALYYYNLGMDIAVKQGNRKEASNFYQNMAMIYRQQAEYEKALGYYNKSLEIRKEIGELKGMASVYNSLGILYNNQDNLTVALDYYQKALRAFEEFDDQMGIARTRQNIGLLYMKLNEPEKAVEYLLLSMAYFEKMNYLGYLFISYNNIGVIYKDLRQFDTAKIYLNKSLEASKRMNDKSNISRSQINLGNIEKIQGHFERAKEYYTDALPYLEEKNDIKNLANLYFGLGSLHNKFDMFSAGRRWCEKGYELSNKHNFLEEKLLNCECLTDANKNLGNISKAFAYLTEYYALRDTIQRLANMEELTRLELQYEFDKQHMVDSLAMEEDKLKQELVYQEDLNAQKTQRNAFMFVGAGVFIFALLLYSRLLFVRRVNHKLEDKNKIIEREKLRAEESERSKERFFNNVSHEFRTPLTLILGPLDKIISKTKDIQLKYDLNIMQRNANRLYYMINELLNLYKLESGKIKLRARYQDIGQFVYRYIQSFEPLAQQKNIKLAFTADSKMLEVYFDSEKMEKVLGNLLSNAFKFVDAGGKVEVSVTRKSISAENNYEGVLISVADDGIGIPPDKIEHVFDRFYQVDESLSRNYEGTGIGLSLTKELVELHHGYIRAESKPGKGAAFYFFLPFGRDHLNDDEIVEEKEEIIISGKPTTTARPDEEDPLVKIDKKDDLPVLLVVEDNPDMRTYIKSELSESYLVLEANNGEEGLKVAMDSIPDLIISDIMMPKMDGNVMTLKLKSLELTSHIPVILVTARTTVEQKIEGLETGADAYLSKPFNSRELRVRVKKLIEQRSQLQARFANNLDNAIRLADTNITSMDQQFLEKALALVEANISNQEFTVENFGREMAMSRVQLHRKLTALTNQSASRFIRTIRLKHAAEFLSKDGANVTETAYKFGFNNLSYFAKCFSEDYGMSPKEWVKKHNKGK